MPAGSAFSVARPPDLPPEQDPIRQLLARRVPWAIHGDVFSQQSLGVGPVRAQGWKLHVSGTPLSAVDVLDRALPVLLAEGVRFKVVTSRAQLMDMNAGRFGEPQVGKFLTIYPADDDQAVRLAVALDQATSGLPGPRIPTDRPLRPGSLVHYRYGAFQGRVPPAFDGEPAPPLYDLLDLDGRLTIDPRPPFYLPPPGRADPFEAAGVVATAPARSGPFAGRYLIVELLGRTWRGGVFRAIDLAARPARSCLLKEVWHNVGTDRYGRDATDWVENEARLLRRHHGDPLLPRCYDRFEQDGNAYIALEFVEGEPLDRSLGDEQALRTGLPADEVAEIARGTAEALAGLHALGIVFRDFKPENVIRTPDGGYRLIDFGIAYEAAADGEAPPLGLGTLPYVSPEQSAGAAPAAADDVFAWGVFLHQLACGLEQAATPDAPSGSSAAAAPFPAVRALRPGFPSQLAAVIDRAISWDRRDRYATMAEALAALRTMLDVEGALCERGERARRRAARHGSVRTHVSAELPSSEPLAVARTVGDALCAAALERDGGLCWAVPDSVDRHPRLNPDLYDGAGGIGLFLAELARATGEARYEQAARGAARWLAGPAWGAGRALPGLHVGEAGVAWFFLRLAELLDEPGYITAAELRVRRLAGAPFQTLDLIAGAAGTAVLLVHLADVTGDSGYLQQARAMGDLLLAAAQPAADGAGRYWNVPTLDPSEAPRAYLGIAHGAAGIALALDLLASATGERAYAACARRAADLLLAQAVEQGEGLRWPTVMGEARLGPQAWCHGAAGVGLFFLQMGRRGGSLPPDGPDSRSRYLAAARRAAITVAGQVETRTQSGLCHGLAGDGRMFLDYYRALGDTRSLALARRCFRRMEQVRAEDRTRVRSGNAAPNSPDLMLGAAGVGAFSLELARLEGSAPHSPTAGAAAALML